MTYYNLKEKWKKISEEQESTEFAFLLENVFTKRKVTYIKYPYKNRILKEADDDDLPPPSFDKDDLPPPSDEDRKQFQQVTKTGKTQNSLENNKTKQSNETPQNKKEETPKQQTTNENPQDTKQGEQKEQPQTAVIEPINPNIFEKFQQKNKEIINLIFEKSGNGIPETSPQKIEEFAQFRISPEGSAYDKEVINTITVLSKNISTNDYDKFVNEAYNILKGKATEKGGFPKNVNTVKNYLNEINNVLKNIGLMKNVNEKEKNAYALYLSFVFAGGYNFIHSGSTGTVGNVAEAFNSTKNDTAKFFETVLALSKELPQDEFIDQVTEYVNNNFPLDETEDTTNNFKIYISNVYKLRSLMAKVKKQTKIIQKMMKKE